jgi:hypothetical protein
MALSAQALGGSAVKKPPVYKNPYTGLTSTPNSLDVRDPFVPSTVTTPGLGGSIPGGPVAGLTPGAPSGYLSELTSQPDYLKGLDAYNAAMQSNRNTLRDQIQQAVIQSGYVPSLSGELAQYGADIDEQTKAAAAGNQMSQKAQLDKQYQQGLTDLAWRLAGLGTGTAMQGGMGTALTGNLKDQYDTAGYNSMQSLLQALGQNVGGYNQSSQGLLSNWIGQQQNIAGRLAALQGPTYPDATAPAAPAAPSYIGGGTQATPGGVVTDASGGYYDPRLGIYVPRKK